MAEVEAPFARVQRSGFVVVLVAAWFGANLVVAGISGAAAPRALAVWDPDLKDARLAVVAGIGGLVLMIATPLLGRLSDRTTARAGMRRPWMVGGTLVGFAGVVALAHADGLATMVWSWCVVQVGFGAVTVAQHALLADQVPTRIRARVAGATGIASGMALIAGAALVSVLPDDQRRLWFLVPGAVGSALCLVLVAVLRDAVLTGAPPPLTLRVLLSTYWLSPVRYRDFAWAWACRFLVTTGMVSVMLYLLYFIVDRLSVPLDQASGVQARALGCYFVGSALSAALLSWVSDRTGRRKPIVLAACGITACGLLLAVSSTDQALFLAALVVIGIGQGAYIAVDVALMTEVLPSFADAGKDLGVVALAYQLPQVVVPLTAAPIVVGWGSSGYVVLYVWAAFLVLVGGLAVLPVRAVR